MSQFQENVNVDKGIKQKDEIEDESNGPNIKMKIEHDVDNESDDVDDVNDDDFATSEYFPENISTHISKNILFENHDENEDQEDENENEDSVIDEDEDDDNYLQKFEQKMKQNVLELFHPELQQIGESELEARIQIIRDVDGNIIDAFHQTLPFVTKYEKARILGERARQLEAGAIPFVKIETSMIDGYLIALKEYEQKKIPFILKRPLPNGKCEYWKFCDLE